MRGREEKHLPLPNVRTGEESAAVPVDDNEEIIKNLCNNVNTCARVVYSNPNATSLSVFSGLE